MAFMEGFSALGAMPGVDELAGGFVFKRAANRDFHIAHWTPRKLRTSDQKSAISRSTSLNK
jgi:hypothetical protein